ncbi:uncharacterized protein SCHCODRAFT_02509577 [Schizophyllum commune H4-8]|uniref:Uncharacterized protein n=1 Tax=Schizophyllum commune (strain H4-8 / FGSC 9210) TaxID=578458 RepID=D8QB73_SCHCM|nr:uncharacterized protein SCHCODRAFT_02509577 [Schizophyllum commune H4-8]KAI5889060.1 hypothetical protein SCHCODRAFT_02509577 [Schizophyllum commune H4-8]
MSCSAFCTICLDPKVLPEQFSFFVSCGTSDTDLNVNNASGQLGPSTGGIDAGATQLLCLGDHPRLNSDTKDRTLRALSIFKNEMRPTVVALEKERADDALPQVDNALPQVDIAHLLADSKCRLVDADAAKGALESERSRVRALEQGRDQTKTECVRMKEELIKTREELNKMREELNMIKEERDQTVQERDQTKQERDELFKENLDAQRTLTAIMSDRPAMQKARQAMEEHRGQQMADLYSDSEEIDLVSELVRDLNECLDREQGYMKDVKALQEDNISLRKKLREQAKTIDSLLEHAVAEQVARVARSAQNEVQRRGGAGGLRERSHATKACRHPAEKTAVATLPLSVKPTPF